MQIKMNKRVNIYSEYAKNLPGKILVVNFGEILYNVLVVKYRAFSNCFDAD